MKAIDFVVRTGAGAVQFGEIAASAGQTRVAPDPNSEIFLNLRQAEIGAYQRDGANLKITLADGRVILIEDYFSGDLPIARLFVSADGYLNEVTLVEGSGGAMWAQYGPTAEWGKSSPDEALIFLNEDGQLITPAQIAGGSQGNDEVSMLAAVPLLGALGAGGTAAAVVGGAVLVGSGGCGGGGTPPERIPPSINEKDTITRDGDDAKLITISGRAEPGSTVSVGIGGETVVTTADAAGNWTASFADTDFPPDGTHAVTATVVEPTGLSTDLTGPAVLIDTVPPTLEFTTGTQSVDHVVNAVDHADGIAIGGTGEAGAAVAVTVLGVTKTTVVAADGTWSVQYTTAEVAGGEYTAPVTVVTTDAFGNAATYEDALVIDTVPHPITIATALVGGEGTVNAFDALNGVTVTGTSTPGAVLTVAIDGNSQTVTVAADGTWSAAWAQGVIAGGEYDAVVTATTVDAAGNPSSATGTFRMDTVGMVSISDMAIAGDNVVNATEAAAGLTLTGTTQPGSSVTVEIEGVTRTATVAADGTWSATFAAGSLRAGTYDTAVAVTATDAAGNVALAMRQIAVDTDNAVTIGLNHAGGDNTINAVERGLGVTLTGDTHPGSSVMVTLGTVTRPATVAFDGTWTVTFPASDVPQGTADLAVTAIATDSAGNISRAETTVALDTETTVTVTDTGGGADLVVNGAERQDGITISGQAEAGSTAVTVRVGDKSHPATIAADGSWQVDLATTDIPNGESSTVIVVTATDRAGNTGTTRADLQVDTVVNRLTSRLEVDGADMVVNAAEHPAGVVLNGQVEPGSRVVVQLGSTAMDADVAADGSWSAVFAAADVPMGELTVPVTTTATDAAGNTRATSTNLRIDTVFNTLSLGPDPVEGDDIINAAEAANGTTITGMSNPDAMVTVTFGGATRTVGTNRLGVWRANFLASEIPPDTDAALITATTTDAAGNVTRVTGTVAVDTVVENMGITTDPVNGLGLINSAALTTGLVLTGTTEPGSTTVRVVLDGQPGIATVTPDGRWTAVFDPAQLPTGERDVTLAVTATDRNGNTDTVSDTIRVDTLVNRLENAATPVAGDNVINAAEARSGVTLTGKVEPGSTVTVALEGRSFAATTAADGTWSATIPGNALPTGSATATAIIAATDAAGNTASITRLLAFDLDVPDAANVVNYTRDHTGIVRIGVETSGDDLTVAELRADGTVIEDRATGVEVPALGETLFSFATAVPDGSHLIVATTDAAGNTSGTYLVFDELATSVVNLPAALGAQQIDAIDLQFAEDSQLTITEAQLRGLSDNSDTLLIHGGTDDTVIARGAERVAGPAGSVQVDGQGYVVYTLGADGRLVIEEDIQVLI